MKKKIAIGVLLIVLSAALIGGTTMAWFTAKTEVAAAEFTAGTVIIDAEDPTVSLMDGKFIDNINPGDCATVCWEIVNTGTKAAQLRVKLSDVWSVTDEYPNGLPTANVHYAPAPKSDWVMYEEEGEIWFYYTGKVEDGIPGTYKDLDPTTVKLCVVVGFDGEDTNDFYQGATYTISGEAWAVQASNSAPTAVWGSAWDLATADDYNFDNLINYFLGDNPGSKMPCWKGEDPVIVPDPDPEMYTLTLDTAPDCFNWGSVTGAGSKAEGSSVTVTANPNWNRKFVKWTDVNGNTVSSNPTYIFTMPSDHYKLTAHFRVSIFGLAGDAEAQVTE